MFFYFPQLAFLAAILAIIFLTICLLSFARRRKRWIQIVSFLFSLPSGLACAFLLAILFFGLIMGGGPDRPPKYSPDHKMEAGIRYAREGVGASVHVYSSHGLHNHEVFFHPEKNAVQENDIQWIDNQHLVIHYQLSPHPDEAAHCYNTRDIQVQCIAKPAP